MDHLFDGENGNITICCNDGEFKVYDFIAKHSSVFCKNALEFYESNGKNKNMITIDNRKELVIVVFKFFYCGFREELLRDIFDIDNAISCIDLVQQLDLLNKKLEKSIREFCHCYIKENIATMSSIDFYVTWDHIKDTYPTIDAIFINHFLNLIEKRAIDLDEHWYSLSEKLQGRIFPLILMHFDTTEANILRKIGNELLPTEVKSKRNVKIIVHDNITINGKIHTVITATHTSGIYGSSSKLSSEITHRIYKMLTEMFED